MGGPPGTVCARGNREDQRGCGVYMAGIAAGVARIEVAREGEEDESEISKGDPQSVDTEL